jgi:dTDP-4-amino-4,6-dideoxygalactose transaminase
VDRRGRRAGRARGTALAVPHPRTTHRGVRAQALWATGARHAVAVANGTAALQIACLAAGLDAGAHGVLPQVHYIPVHRQPDFRRAGLADGSFPGADDYYAGCISLPMFPALTDEDVDCVVATLAAGAARP